MGLIITCNYRPVRYFWKCKESHEQLTVYVMLPFDLPMIIPTKATVNDIFEGLMFHMQPGNVPTAWFVYLKGCSSAL